MENKDYWFSLESHVYVEFKEKEILLYNTINGKYIESSDMEFISLISELYKPENLGVVLFSKEKQKKGQLYGLIEETLAKEMSSLMDVKKVAQKPIRLIPILNLQRDVEKLGKNDERSIGEDVINYLLEVNIHINSTCEQQCAHCYEYNKQFSCCASNVISSELPSDTIKSVLNQIKYSPVGRINILGGNIAKYNKLDQLVEILKPFEDAIHYYQHYLNYENNDFFNSKKVEIIINFPINIPNLEKNLIGANQDKTTFHFIIENKKQYDDVENIISDLKIENYNILPFYTKQNLNFFSENIFLEKEDILSNTVKLREIFRNKKLNSNFFGVLHILSDGDIKANINANSLGNIKNDKILDIVYKEMIENTAWRKIRDCEPCNKCLYQFLCPAPSNYEKVMAKTNLCNINV